MARVRCVGAIAHAVNELGSAQAQRCAIAAKIYRQDLSPRLNRRLQLEYKRPVAARTNP